MEAFSIATNLFMKMIEGSEYSCFCNCSKAQMEEAWTMDQSHFEPGSTVDSPQYVGHCAEHGQQIYSPSYWYLLISFDIYYINLMIHKVAGWDEPWRVRRRPLWHFGRRWWWWCRPEGCVTCRRSKVLPCDHFNRQKGGSWKKWTRKNGWRKVQRRQNSPLREPCPVHRCFEIHLSQMNPLCTSEGHKAPHKPT